MIAKQVTKLAGYSHGLMILTIIHHIYGAFLYDTLWRLHVLFISIPVLVLTFILQRVLTRYDGKRTGRAFWIFMLLTLLVSIGTIGIVEGLYNHVLKNMLFFGGVSASTLQQLFPAPTYEMPNDFLFEVSGVSQGFVVFPMFAQVVKLFRCLKKSS